MPIILSKSGDSLADIYDVRGSIAGIDNLETQDLPIVHEMAQTVFSERFSSSTRNVNSGAVNQNTTWGVNILTLPEPFSRLTAVQMFVDTTARTSLAALFIVDPLLGREIPIWMWDVATDIEVGVMFVNDGAGAAITQFLVPVSPQVVLPQLMAGNGQPAMAQNMTIRGRTTGFGAGTVTVTCMLHQLSLGAGGSSGMVDGSLSSRGLPIPSW